MSTVKELINLSGRRALITGAAGGLGKVFADTLAELGADLILVDRQSSDLKPLKESIEKQWRVKIENYFCDLEVPEQRVELISKLSRTCGINILVNNAAFVGASDLQGWNVPFAEQSLESWRRALEVNLTAIFDLSQGLLPILKNSEGASIINIASIYGIHGPDWRLYEGTNIGNPAAYSASKGGLIQLTRWLAATINPEVRVNAIAPGGIYRDQPEVFVKQYEAKVPLGRMGNEDDFRGIIGFLASDLSKYITGQIISVDGGWGII